MIELGEYVFNGTIEEFNNSIKSNAIIVQMENPPQLDELRKLDWIMEAENTNDGRIRCFFNPEENIQERFIEEAISKGWKLQEIYKERIEPDEIFKYFSIGKHRKMANEII
jgi:ABC-2 type transport system ATP-binding protein